MTNRIRERLTDLNRLRAWVDEGGSERIAKLIDTGVSMYTLDQMLRGNYKKSPRGSTRKLFCDATGLSEDELFPLVGAKGKKQAS